MRPERPAPAGVCSFRWARFSRRWELESRFIAGGKADPGRPGLARGISGDNAAREAGGSQGGVDTLKECSARTADGQNTVFG